MRRICRAISVCVLALATSRALLPVSAVAAGSGYKVKHDGGSLSDLKAARDVELANLVAFHRHVVTAHALGHSAQGKRG
jgi:hypothetical protein